jgi:uncharacterized protein DUF5989
MRRFRYLLGLVKEIGQFAAANKAWWLVPITVILVLVAAVITLGSSAAPLIYTLF